MKAPTLIKVSNSASRCSRKTKKTARTGVSKVLLTKLAVELDRLFWRKEDVLCEAKKVQQVLCAPGTSLAANQRNVDSLIQTLKQIPTPAQISVTVIELDGTSHTVPIQAQFYAKLDAEGGLHSCMATVADMKIKIEEVTGIRAVCQLLHGKDQDESLVDSDTIEDSGLDKVQTLFLVVDADRHYWQEHAMLVRQFKPAVIRVFKVMSAFKSNHGSVDARTRVAKFLKSCRKALAFLLENDVAHKARPMKTLRLVEGHLKSVVMPIFSAINLAFDFRTFLHFKPYQTYILRPPSTKKTCRGSNES